MLLIALLLFTLGTIIASVAKHIASLLVGRCFQGIGGGGLVALTYVIVSDMVTLKERGKGFSIISLQWAIGSAMGPVICGLFAEKMTWRCELTPYLFMICLSSVQPRKNSAKISQHWICLRMFISLLKQMLMSRGFLGIFWFNLPFCAVAAMGIPICLRLNPLQGSVWARLRKFDWLGSFLFVASTTSFLVPLTWVCLPLRKP